MLLLVQVMLAGLCCIGNCPGGVAPGNPGRSTFVASPVQLAHVVALPADTVPAGVIQAEQVVIAAVGEYWERAFPDLFGKPYRGPRILGGYVGDQGPTCGDDPAPAFNAFYCDNGDFLAWDQNLMINGYRRIGVSWVYLIIAHEWGHAIQARIRHRQVSVASELQADCLAGATLAGARADGLITMPTDAATQLGRTLAANADKYPWTRGRDHGNATERIAAYNLGVRSGVHACLEH
jgi:hypothetical protein